MRKIWGTFALVVESFVNVLFVASWSIYEVSPLSVYYIFVCFSIDMYVMQACYAQWSPSNREKSIPSTMATVRIRVQGRK